MAPCEVASKTPHSSLFSNSNKKSFIPGTIFLTSSMFLRGRPKRRRSRHSFFVLLLHMKIAPERETLGLGPSLLRIDLLEVWPSFPMCVCVCSFVLLVLTLFLSLMLRYSFSSSDHFRLLWFLWFRFLF